MDSITRQPRLLVKMAGAPERAEFALAGGGKIKAEFEPLFVSIRPESGPGLAAAATWHQMSAGAQGAEVNAWDLSHRLLTEGFGVSGMSAPVYAEPDLEQAW